MKANSALAGGIFDSTVRDSDATELNRLVDDLGRRSAEARFGTSSRPEPFDLGLWRNLEDTGLSRLTSTPELGAGPTELAIVLRGLARHAGAVPIAETDLLAAWLGDIAELSTTPQDGPLTIAVAEGAVSEGRIGGTATDVPWTSAAGAVVLVARTAQRTCVALAKPAELDVEPGHNLAGEPRDTIRFQLPANRFHDIPSSVVDELFRRGAWARCVQIIGALDATTALTIAHTRDRVQFGRPLSRFQAVQQSLATMAGEVECARAITTLAVAAASDHGFGAHQTDYAVTAAKVVLDSSVSTVTTIAHQLHGAIGSTMEHPLWHFTMRAQSWIGEFGSRRDHARRLGVLAVSTDHPWDVVYGRVSSGQVGPR